MSPRHSAPGLHLQAMAAALGHEFLKPTPPNVGLALVAAAGLVAWSLVAFLRRAVDLRWGTRCTYGRISWNGAIVVR
jgi:hypothetical protein